MAIAPVARTAHTPKLNRTLSVLHRIHDSSREACGVVINDGPKQDVYGVVHASGSCEVRWIHEDGTRDYVVTCSAATGEPIRCTCPAGRWYAGECRHRAATRVLTARGHVRMDVVEDAGHDRGATE